MKSANRVVTLGIVAIALSLAGCGNSEETTTSNTESTVGQGAPSLSTAPVVQKNGNIERVQGIIKVDIGKGVQVLPSIATVLNPDAGQSAGRTVYSSKATYVKAVDIYSVELEGKSQSQPSAMMVVNLLLSGESLTLKEAEIAYYPNSRNRAEFYKDYIELTDVTIDRLDRKDETTFAISGSFRGSELGTGVLAEELKGQTLATISGQFDFSEVHIFGIATK